MRLCSRPNERYTTLFSSSSLTGTESCTMFPILCRHAFVAVSASFSASTNTAIFALTAATCLMASSASSPARFSAETALFALLNSELAWSSSHRASRHLASSAMTSSTSSTRL